jgi:hypothetical protein
MPGYQGRDCGLTASEASARTQLQELVLEHLSTAVAATVGGEGRAWDGRQQARPHSHSAPPPHPAALSFPLPRPASGLCVKLQRPQRPGGASRVFRGVIYPRRFESPSRAVGAVCH